jgi:hypothetical protein
MKTGARKAQSEAASRPRREIRRNAQTIFHSGAPVHIPDNLSPKNLAAEEGELIHDSVVDLSDASKFLKGHVAVAAQMPDHVTSAGADTYSLSPRILKELLIFRYLGVGNEHSVPADRVASALYWCARSLAFELAFFTTSNKLDAWRDYLEAINDLGRGHLQAKNFVIVPVSGDGQIFEPWSHPDLARLSIHFEFNTELARMRHEGKDLGSIVVPSNAGLKSTPIGNGAGQEFEVERLPELTIKLQGSPVARMMVAALNKGANADTVAQRFTVTVLSGVLHELKRFLGISSKRGRPPLEIGKQAALLLDYHHVNIVQAVAQLCPKRTLSDHRHDKHCQDQVRLAARQYYKSLKREFGRYLPAKAKKT